MNKQTDAAKIKFEFTPTNCYFRWPCHICGGHTDKDAILCEVLKGSHKGLRICDQCLEAGKEKVDARLQSNIAQLEEHTAYLRTLTGRLEFPSYSAWREAGRKENQEWLEAEGIAAPLAMAGHTEDDIPY